MSKKTQGSIQITKNTLVTGSIVFGVVILLVFGFVMVGGSSGNADTNNNGSAIQSGDNQIVEMTAKTGYSPSSMNAQANKATILRVKTDNTFDCSSSVNIPSLGIRKNLPSSGSTDIEIAAQKPGTTVNGTCGMGMYRFSIKFS